MENGQENYSILRDWESTVSPSIKNFQKLRVIFLWHVMGCYVIKANCQTNNTLNSSFQKFSTKTKGHTDLTGKERQHSQRKQCMY